MGDDSDEREREAYLTSHYFEMPQQQDGMAYLIPGLPFGFEYLDEVTLREVNYSLRPGVGQSVTIAGEDQPEQGYRVCRGCGVVARVGFDDASSADRLRHTGNCAYASGDGNWLNVYLYRGMASEALRILLPVSTVMVEEKLATFEACLWLGLRCKFGGEPDHLQLWTHTEPTAEGARRRYLVIYDTVPGGTSFLRDLVEPSEFFGLLSLALDRLRSCACRLDEHKRACYRCLYAYGRRRDIDLVSRELGIEMLSEILAQREKVRFLTSLSGVPMDSLIESELEQRFVNALAEYAKQTWHTSLGETLRRGKRCWELKTPSHTWLIEPQVNLGSSDGLSVSTRADFVFRPLSDPSLKPVVVYADGYAFHACPDGGESRIADDVRIRRALIDSGRFVVWSVTWDDVAELDEGKHLGVPELLPDGQRASGRVLAGLGCSLPSSLRTANAVQQVTAYLATPQEEEWQRLAFGLSLAAMTPLRPSVQQAVVEDLSRRMTTEIHGPTLDVPRDAPQGAHLYGIVGHSYARLVLAISGSALQERDVARLTAVLRLEDLPAQRQEVLFKIEWRRFLLASNLLQFLDGFSLVTAEYVQSHGTEAIGEAEPEEAVADGRWLDVQEYADPACSGLLKACMQAGLPPPEVGYELVDGTGRIVASAELAWPGRRTAVLLQEQQDHERFADAGWTAFGPEDVERVVQWLSEGSD